jgi:UDP-N-acetylmuramoylalanine--D-glutamate ligase
VCPATGFADLAGKTVGIFGYGIEGHATKDRLEGKCQLIVVDDVAGEGVDFVTQDGGLEALATCDVVLKSPGISKLRPELAILRDRGITVTSALNCWIHEAELERVIAITGTKGKSTTTALVHFFLQSCGAHAHRLGNIGQPPYDPTLDLSSGWLVLEVSSFQATDLDTAPGTVVVTSLGSDHVDWHGSQKAYINDKLRLTRGAGQHATFVPDAEVFHDLRDEIGGDIVFVPSRDSDLARTLGLFGEHSKGNVALALRVAAHCTGFSEDDVENAVRANASNFTPLPGRLTLVGREQREGCTITYIDDGLATSTLPTIAALNVFAEDPVALLAGGFDRGVDYSPLVDALASRTERTVVVTMGNAGARIGAALHERAADVMVAHVATLKEGVSFARSALPQGGVVLLSPGAPSFDAYKNWAERSADFTEIARTFL